MRSSLRLRSPFVSFAMFQVAFFTLMWVSKSVHLLYFEEHQATLNFGVSYSSMALVGYFSFVTGHFNDVFGHRRALILGCLIYAGGLYLRVYPESFVIAVVSGLISGMGASFALAALRAWMVDLTATIEISKMVGVRTSTTALGTAIGCAMLGLVSLGGRLSISLTYRDLLLSSALGMAALGIGLLVLGRPWREREGAPATIAAPFTGLVNLLRTHRKIALTTVLLGVMTGFYVSFISPYLPLIMKEKGFTLTSIGLSTAAFALIRFFLDPWSARFVGRFQSKSLAVYLGSELFITLITAAFLWPVSKWSFVMLLILRSCVLGLSAISEELLWFKVFPKERIGFFFGLNQSAFFLGDFAGGLMNGYLYDGNGLGTCIQIVVVIMLVNAAVFAWLFKTPKPIARSVSSAVAC